MEDVKSEQVTDEPKPAPPAMLGKIVIVGLSNGELRVAAAGVFLDEVTFYGVLAKAATKYPEIIVEAKKAMDAAKAGGLLVPDGRLVGPDGQPVRQS